MDQPSLTIKMQWFQMVSEQKEPTELGALELRTYSSFNPHMSLDSFIDGGPYKPPLGVCAVCSQSIYIKIKISVTVLQNNSNFM